MTDSSGPTSRLRVRFVLLAALAVTVEVATILGVWGFPRVFRSLGDTDDAMRLVMVRRLLDGAGWYDQRITRLQPPEGVYMHWSRLLDGAIATLDKAAGAFLDPAAAETFTRFAWPLLWIFPAVACALFMARALKGAAVYPCALLLAMNFRLFTQFTPGRIDHHDVQITLVLAALAAAMATFTSRRIALLAAVAGVATALAIAIGVECLPYLAIVGAYFVLRFVWGGEPRAARAYGLALGLAAPAAFLAQTPPPLRMTPVCDALGPNLTTGLVLLGLGLAGATWMARRGGWGQRAALAGLVAVVGTAGCLLQDTSCIHGPGAHVDPKLAGMWLNRIAELQPLGAFFIGDPTGAILSAAGPALGLAGLAWLAWTPDYRRRPDFQLLAASLLLASAFTLFAIRYADYAQWFAVPVLAVVVVRLAQRVRHLQLAATALLALVASPFLLSMAAAQVILPATRSMRPPPLSKPVLDAKGRCYETRNYASLGSLRPGLALAAVDLGPFVLATSPLSVVGAPYHRLDVGLPESYRVFALPADGAASTVRALHIDYVLSCQGFVINADNSAFGPGSLQAALYGGRPPAWLERLSRPGAVIDVYRVRPASP